MVAVAIQQQVVLDLWKEKKQKTGVHSCGHWEVSSYQIEVKLNLVQPLTLRHNNVIGFTHNVFLKWYIFVHKHSTVHWELETEQLTIILMDVLFPIPLVASPVSLVALSRGDDLADLEGFLLSLAAGSSTGG